MRRELDGGLELDDDPDRIDLDAVHRFLSEEAYWAKGRARDTQEQMNRTAARLVGLYDDGRQVGFARVALVQGMEIAYLCDVYVLSDYRGKGLGVELVREAIENGPFAGHRWLLHTDDAHSLYERFGFEPSKRLMERPKGF
jgi:GNAT superfamily N-acetyltransferase